MASAFPQSGDENVEIRLTSDKKDTILLHSYVLALHSKWFKASFSERWNGQDSSTTPKDGKNRWVYELRFDKGTSLGMLVRQSGASSGLQATTELVETLPPTPGLSALAALKMRQESKDWKVHKERLACIEAHKQMLGALYHIVPFLNHDFTRDAKDPIILLVKTADAYDCRGVVNIPVDNHLRVHRQKVLDTCAESPVDMLELSTALQSDWIFKDAFANIIAAPTHKYDEKAVARLRELGLAEFVAEKREELREKLTAVDVQLLTIEVTPEDDEIPGNCQIANAFFRQWVAERLTGFTGKDKFKPRYPLFYRNISHLGFGEPDEELEEEARSFLSNAESSLTPQDDLRPMLKRIAEEANVIVSYVLCDVTLRRETCWYEKEKEPRVLTFMGIKDEEIPWKNKKMIPNLLYAEIKDVALQRRRRIGQATGHERLCEYYCRHVYSKRWPREHKNTDDLSERMSGETD